MRNLKLLLVISLLGAFLGTFGFAVQHEAQEVDEAQVDEEVDVKEPEIKLYIDVYGAMQTDHDLKILDAVASHKLTLDEFRVIERKIQKEQYIVDRVRKALLEKAQSRMADIGTPGTLPRVAEKPRN